jgi:hypothetical protein
MNKTKLIIACLLVVGIIVQLRLNGGRVQRKINAQGVVTYNAPQPAVSESHEGNCPNGTCMRRATPVSPVVIPSKPAAVAMTAEQVAVLQQQLADLQQQMEELKAAQEKKD